MKLVLGFTLGIIAMGCILKGNSANLNEEFTLKNHEVLRVTNTDLQIKAGDEIHSAGPLRPRESCRYKLIYEGVARHVDSELGKTESVGNLKIKTQRAGNGWCSFIVTRQ